MRVQKTTTTRTEKPLRSLVRSRGNICRGSRRMRTLLPRGGTRKPGWPSCKSSRHARNTCLGSSAKPEKLRGLPQGPWSVAPPRLRTLAGIALETNCCTQALARGKHARRKVEPSSPFASDSHSSQTSTDEDQIKSVPSGSPKPHAPIEAVRRRNRAAPWLREVPSGALPSAARQGLLDARGLAAKEFKGFAYGQFP